MQYFDRRFLTTPNDNQVEITIFGNGNGESILTFIPGIGWGLIDCCRCNIEKEKVIPAFQYLAELYNSNLPNLNFVVITHPHIDHYSGIDHLLDNYPGNIDRLCRYAAEGIPEFKTYISQHSVATNIQPTVPKIKTMLDAFQRRKKKGSKIYYLNDAAYICNKLNECIPGYGTTSIQLRSLSPSSESVDIYKQLLFTNLAANGDVFKPLPAYDHNIVSVALLLSIGDLQILFSGDVVNREDNPRTGWNGIVNDESVPSLAVDVIKVAHHGSAGAHSDAAWAEHTSKRKPFCLVAPYDRHNLPEHDQVAKLSLLSSQIGFSSQPKIYKNLTKFYSKEVALSISSFLNTPKLHAQLNKIGAARLRISLDGTHQQTDSHGSGLWVTPQK